MKQKEENGEEKMTEGQKAEPILEHADGSFVKIITSWKEYPHDQWLREQELGRIRQALFKVPEKDICGGIFNLICIADYGWVYRCRNCGFQVSAASHTIFWTNYESIVHMV